MLDVKLLFMEIFLKSIFSLLKVENKVHVPTFKVKTM